MANTTSQSRHLYALVDYEDEYVQPLVLAALKARLNPSEYRLVKIPFECPTKETPLLQFLSYETLDFERLLSHPKTNFANAYIIRKALIRKHYLSHTVANWITKHPQTSLKSHFKPGVDFELDYAEFLEEALLEAYELRESFTRNEEVTPEKREWWILKPGMSDRGQGIRLFSVEEELQAIFEEWEAEREGSEDEDGEEGIVGEDDVENEVGNVSSQVGFTDTKGQTPPESPATRAHDIDGIITSQLRHFVAQPYIHPPLLLASSGGRKFHIRIYVIAVGALKVYVYKPMLALFAAKPYAPPWENEDLKAHLTNTCLQGSGNREGSVRAFWELEDDATAIESKGARRQSLSWKDLVYDQICKTTGELFEAAARGQVVHFQPLPNAFELFGLDFLVDAAGTAYLLEVNAFPDFRQTGDELRGLIAGLFERVVDVAVKPFFGLQQVDGDDLEDCKLVLDIDLGRRT